MSSFQWIKCDAHSVVEVEQSGMHNRRYSIIYTNHFDYDIFCSIRSPGLYKIDDICGLETC